MKNSFLKEIAKYKMIKVIGSGANAICYLAEKEDELYVIKEYMSTFFGRDDNGNLFFREDVRTEECVQEQVRIRTMASYENEVICNIRRDFEGSLDLEIELFSEWDGVFKTKLIYGKDYCKNDTCYLISSTASGMTYKDYIDKKDITLVEKLEVFVQVCKNVGRIHEKGYLHLDVKPENIWVTDSGIRMLDFGGAIKKGQPMDAEMILKTAVGNATPQYASIKLMELAKLKEICQVDNSKEFELENMLTNLSEKEDNYALRCMFSALVSDCLLQKQVKIGTETLMNDILDGFLNDNISDKEIIDKLKRLCQQLLEDNLDETQLLNICQNKFKQFRFPYIYEELICTGFEENNLVKGICADNIKWMIQGIDGMGKTLTLFRIFRILLCQYRDFNIRKWIPIYIDCGYKADFDVKKFIKEKYGLDVEREQNCFERKILFLLDNVNKEFWEKESTKFIKSLNFVLTSIEDLKAEGGRCSDIALKQEQKEHFVNLYFEEDSFKRDKANEAVLEDTTVQELIWITELIDENSIWRPGDNIRQAIIEMKIQSRESWEDRYGRVVYYNKFLPWLGYIVYTNIYVYPFEDAFRSKKEGLRYAVALAVKEKLIKFDENKKIQFVNRQEMVFYAAKYILEDYFKWADKKETIWFKDRLDNALLTECAWQLGQKNIISKFHSRWHAFDGIARDISNFKEDSKIALKNLVEMYEGCGINMPNLKIYQLDFNEKDSLWIRKKENIDFVECKFAEGTNTEIDFIIQKKDSCVLYMDSEGEQRKLYLITGKKECGKRNKICEADKNYFFEQGVVTDKGDYEYFYPLYTTIEYLKGFDSDKKPLYGEKIVHTGCFEKWKYRIYGEQIHDVKMIEDRLFILTRRYKHIYRDDYMDDYWIKVLQRGKVIKQKIICDSRVRDGKGIRHVPTEITISNKLLCVGFEKYDNQYKRIYGYEEVGKDISRLQVHLFDGENMKFLCSWRDAEEKTKFDFQQSKRGWSWIRYDSKELIYSEVEICEEDAAIETYKKVIPLKNIGKVIILLKCNIILIAHPNSKIMTLINIKKLKEGVIQPIYYELRYEYDAKSITRHEDGTLSVFLYDSEKNYMLLDMEECVCSDGKKEIKIVCGYSSL